MTAPLFQPLRAVLAMTARKGWKSAQAPRQIQPPPNTLVPPVS